MDQLDDPGQHLGICLWHDPVAQVEDVSRRLCALGDDLSYGPFQRRPRSEQQCGVQVALYGVPVPKASAGIGQ